MKCYSPTMTMTIRGSFTPFCRAGTRAVAFLLLCAVPAMAAEEDTEPVREAG